MKEIQAGQQHVIIASRADGAVGIFYARDPLNWLAALGTHAPLEDVEVRPSAAAAKVVEQLRARFAPAHFPSTALPWYLIDYSQAVQALDQLDLDTGELSDHLKHGAEVMVLPHRNRGQMYGYTRGGQVVVKLHSSPLVANIVIAPRQQVKPVLMARTA